MQATISTEASTSALGAALRQAREQRGWSQERLRDELRHQLGVVLSQPAIASLELGATRIGTPNTLAALSQVLGTNLFVYVLQPGVRLPHNPA